MKIVILIASLFQLISFSLSKYVLNEQNEMIQVFDVDVYSSMQPKPQTFLLDAKAIKLASLKERKLTIKDNEFVEGNELGLYMGKTPNSNVLDPIHHKYLRNENNRVWLPYSYCGEWKALFNANGTSTITNQLKRTATNKKETPLITIQFRFDKDWEIINQAELNQIVFWLNENTNKRKNIKTLLKLNIKQAAMNYTMAKKSLTDTRTKNANTQQRIANNENQMKTIDGQIAALQQQLEKARQDLANAAAIVKASEKQQQVYQNQQENIAAQIMREKKARSQIVVPNPDTIRMEIATIKGLLLLPSQAPQRFKDDYNLSDNDAIRNAYDSCNTTEERVDECKRNLETYSLQKKKVKKLLRKFF